jgi:hypothetical protein
MLDSLKSQGGKRWPRGQKFVISPTGLAADTEYRDAVQRARAQGRGALEAAQQAWSAPRGLDAIDGVLLGELRSGRKSIADLARALEGCGTTAAEVKASIDRLATAGLIEPVASAAAA